MYEKDTEVMLVTSASLIYGNLKVHYSIEDETLRTFAVIHGGYINILIAHGPNVRPKYLPCIEMGTKPKHITAYVTEVKWAFFGNRYHLLVTSNLGINVYDQEGQIFKFTHPCCDGPRSPGTFARGIALIGDQLLCVGNSSGYIYIFCYPDEESCQVLEVVRLFKAHDQAVISLDSGRKTMISTDNSGVVTIWAIDDSMSHLATIPSFSSVCTSLVNCDSVVIAGYLSGHLRLFESPSGQLLYDVTAHARPVTALDFTPEAGLLLSVSEDSFIRIWQLEPGDKLVQHKSTVHVKDRLIVGCQFLNSKGTEFCVSCYDSAEILCYRT
ncbi:WD repeat-containing protein 54-like [Schistocerca cancellata]|uniref:WD repeat-containing protein 54-like n=1 Tax=Schistocerca cancellata TaxID=274614 RepID=UPI002118865E|nr:WD repeat-containing protein 54-like [Schistocerca cancellata]